MTFSLFELLLIIGLTQGAVASVLLATSSKNKVSNRILALGVFSFCLFSTKMLFNSLGWSDTPQLRYIPIGIQLAIAPFIYFYLLSVTAPKFTLTKNTIYHFIPFFFMQIFACALYVKTFGMQSIAQQDVTVEHLLYGPIKLIEDYLTLLSIVYYLFKGFIALKQYRENIYSNASDTAYPSFNWLLVIFVLSAVLGLFLLLNMLAELVFNLSATTFLHWQIYFVYMSLLIYCLGLIAYKQPHFQVQQVLQKAIIKDPEKLQQDQLNGIISAFENELHNNKAYLNPTLSAIDVATVINVNQSALSFAINKHYQKSFRDVINELRISEVKTKLKHNAENGQSILSIALECGFNSEASFYRIFKKQAGLAPKAYFQSL
ncbi:MAG: AraC-like DNA-binding protein [Glaciecola sp.]|jgi:AraC-like DNA-binding protein